MLASDGRASHQSSVLPSARTVSMPAPCLQRSAVLDERCVKSHELPTASGIYWLTQGSFPNTGAGSGGRFSAIVFLAVLRGEVHIAPVASVPAGSMVDPETGLFPGQLAR